MALDTASGKAPGAVSGARGWVAVKAIGAEAGVGAGAVRAVEI